MKIEKGTVVSLTYQLTADSVEIETVTAGSPFVFLFGAGSLIRGFEKNLSGLVAGDAFDFLVKSEEGYGARVENSVIKLSRKDFEGSGEPVDSLLKAGNRIRLGDTEGREFIGLITGISGEEVTVDLNHPLAGKDLHFKGTIVQVRKASDEEIAHGHVHGHGAHHH